MKTFVLISTNGAQNIVVVNAAAALALLQSQYGEETGLAFFVNIVSGASKCVSVAGAHMLEYRSP